MPAFRCLLVVLLQKDVVSSYVVEAAEGGAITDLVSFYTLPSSIIGNEQYDSLKVRPVAAAVAGCCGTAAAVVPASPGSPCLPLPNSTPSTPTLPMLTRPRRRPTSFTRCRGRRRCRS